MMRPRVMLAFIMSKIFLVRVPTKKCISWATLLLTQNNLIPINWERCRLTVVLAIPTASCIIAMDGGLWLWMSRIVQDIAKNNASLVVKSTEFSFGC